MSKVTASAKAARENSWTALSASSSSRITTATPGPDPARGPTLGRVLLKAKVVKRADEPDPAPEDPEVPDTPASEDLTPTE